MSESNKLNSTTKDKLIADIKQIVIDADVLLQTTTDQAREKFASRRCLRPTRYPAQRRS